MTAVPHWAVESGRRTVPLLGVWFSILLHVAWLGALIASPAATNATAFHGATWLLHDRTALETLLAIVICCALYGVLATKTTAWRIASLIPQQVVLGAAASSALYAIYVGHFADGVTRPQAFLLADQIPVVIAFVIHTTTMIYLAALRWSRW